ncbi:MAG TPA: protein kinase [Gaiellaceae bacterium]|jgi:eukaryotic-like serine/threonine-protein kinase|nr:protein kinase [Gaiellaceae bacterium]
MQGEVIAGRYELLELVGKGGMSSVYKAHDRLLDRQIAVKILHPHFTEDEEYVERFRREARAVAQLSHPNIVTVIDRGEDEGRQFIVFEYVEGENLKQRLERTGPMPVRDALLLALQMARALAFAHGRGLIHRDVKPQNVLLNADGQAKMTDFGIARSIDVQGVTITGTVLGTSEYIAPEQARGERVNAQTDVYSLGVVLYELLVGGVPYEGETFVTVALKHVNEPVPPVLERRPDLPPRVALAVERAMAKSPDDRFSSMQELVDELEACVAELDPGDEQATMISRRPVAAKKAREPRRRRRRLGVLWPIAAVLAVLAVAGLAALGAIALRDGDGDSPQAATGQPIRLTGVDSYDPEGDNKEEHDEAVARATDRDSGTYWFTEDYGDFAKSGVGLVLDAGREVEPTSITVDTDTPGFTAEIHAGDSPQGPFRPVSGSGVIESRRRYNLHDARARYFVVWITDLSGSAHVNEVTAR